MLKNGYGILYFLGLLVVFGHGGTFAADVLSDSEKSLATYIISHREEQVADLKHLVNINSGTMNLSGVRKVGVFFSTELEKLGFVPEWNEMPPEMNRAGHLFARRKGKQGKRLLLIGHLDTVFPKDSPFQKYERKGGIATGPGINDMKDGDLVILYALKALHHIGALDDVTITVALMGDEENTGSPISVSRKMLIEEAKISDVALAFESGIDNRVTVGRKGASGWKLTVEGRRAHSAGILSADTGAGAIYEMARILNAINTDLMGDPALTMSPALALAGTDVTHDKQASEGKAFGKINVVPQSATVVGDLRYLTPEQNLHARSTLANIIKNNLPHTSATVEYWEYYPSMAPTSGNMALAEIYQQASKDLGLGAVGILDPLKRGAADISHVAKHVDSLDGLGGMGGGDHTVQEFQDLSLLPIATQRAALMIYRLTR